MGVEKVVVHPKYLSYNGNIMVGHTDVALVRVADDVFEMDGEEISSSSRTVPICLPAKLGYRLDHDGAVRGIHQPFEDLDCFSIEAGQDVPYPYHRLETEAGVLACHPGAMTRAHDINIAGRSSFLTGFKSESSNPQVYPRL